MRPWEPSVRYGLIALCLVACAPRGPEALPASAREVVDAVEQALERRDYALAHRYVDFRFRLEENLGELWRSGPEEARADLVRRLEEMFDETSELRRDRFAGQPMVRRVDRRAGRHLWVESRVAREDERGKGFAWQYRLTPRGTSWAITQREYLVDGMPSDSTRFWPMAQGRISEMMGRQPTLSELAANLPTVMGTMHIRRLTVPRLDGARSQGPKMP